MQRNNKWKIAMGHDWLTSRLVTGSRICSEIFTKWFPERFSEFRWVKGTSSPIGIGPISAMNNVFKCCSSCSNKERERKKKQPGNHHHWHHITYGIRNIKHTWTKKKIIKCKKNQVYLNWKTVCTGRMCCTLCISNVMSAFSFLLSLPPTSLSFHVWFKIIMENGFSV